MPIVIRNRSRFSRFLSYASSYSIQDLVDDDSLEIPDETFDLHERQEKRRKISGGGKEDGHDKAWVNVEQENNKYSVANSGSGGMLKADGGGNPYHAANGQFASAGNSVIATGVKAEKMLAAKIQSGNLSTKLDVGKQSKHVKGSAAYNKSVKSGIYPRYTTNTNQELQKIINNCNGTVLVRKNGSIVRIGKDSSFKGVCVNSTIGAGTPTTRFTIHHSKTGAHIVPAHP